MDQSKNQLFLHTQVELLSSAPHLGTKNLFLDTRKQPSSWFMLLGSQYWWSTMVEHTLLLPWEDGLWPDQVMVSLAQPCPLDPSQAWSWPWYQAHPVAREGYKENTPNQTKKKVNKNKANNGQLQPLRLQTMGKYISCWNCRAWYSAREIQDTRQETDLSKKNMPNSWINILFNRLARGYHVPILEFHGFGTLCPKLSTHNNLCCYVSESKFQITATMPKKKKQETKILKHTSHPFAPLSITNLNTP